MQMKETLNFRELFRAAKLELPEVPHIARAAKSIKTPTVDIIFEKPRDIDEVARRLRDAFLTGRPLERSDLRHAPWCIWDGENPLERTPEVLNAYLRHVRETGGKGAYRRLAAAYAVRFPTGSPMLRAVAATLSDLANRFSGTWSEAARSLALFDPDAAPKVIASVALKRGIHPTGVLGSYGLSKLAVNSGLAEAAFLAGLRELADARLGPRDRLEAIRRWSLTENGTLLFENHRGKVADALVLPHADNVPEKPDRDRMLSFILEQFRDPRLHSERWTHMSDRCVATVRRWLTERSLRQFLDVVDKVANDSQWKYRRAFWWAVYERGLILDACVVFDELGAETARQIFDRSTTFSRWGRGGTKPIERGHACLLLRVGSGVIAEWSHNGRYHIWSDSSDPTAPRLHRATYRSNEVMIPHKGIAGVAGSHWSPDTYYWQNKVADEVFALTKARVMQSEYVVK